MANRFDWLEFHEGQAPTPPADAEAGQDWSSRMLEANSAFLEGRYEEALRQYSAALKHDRALAGAWAGQVRCLVRLAEYREAQAWASKACALFPTVPVLESARAAALAASGLVPGAMEASDLALELAERTNLQDPQVWLDRATCLLVDGQRGTAGHCLGKVRELRPGDPDWEQRIAVELLEGQDPTGALEALNRVVELRPERAYAWLLLGRAARRLGMRERAGQALDQAERLCPGDPRVLDERRQLKRPCWIATLVFGHEDHPGVVALRCWRDQRWLPCPAGRLAAGLYDRTAPLLCRVLARSPGLRATLHRALSLLVRWLPIPAATRRTSRGQTSRA